MDLTWIKELLINDIIDGWELAEAETVIPEQRCLCRLTQKEINFLARVAINTIINDASVILNEYLFEDYE